MQPHQELATAQHGTAGACAKLLDRHGPDPTGSGNLTHGPVSDQRRDRVGGGRSVAQVASDAGPALNLNASDQRHCINQTKIRAGYRCMIVDPITRHGSAKPETLVQIVTQVIDFRNVLNVHEHIDAAAILPNLNDDVSAAGKHSSPLAVFCEQSDGLGCGSGSGVAESFQVGDPTVFKCQPRH